MLLTIDNIKSLSNNISDYPDGIIIPVDKPYTWGSFDVVSKIKFLFKRFFNDKKLKVGHAGTLDPLATGVLLVCIGKATKLVESLQSQPKEYLTTIVLGASTPSYDREQPPLQLFEYEHITDQMIDNLVAQMVGHHKQVPPMFSAKMVGGKRMYELARKGEDYHLKACPITLYSVERIDKGESLNLNQLNKLQTAPYIGVNGEDLFVVKKKGLPQIITENSPLDPSQISNLKRVSLRIRCSKGTYIRSIARDFGLALGSGGYLEALCRSECAGIKLEQTLSIEDIEHYIQKKFYFL